MSFNGYKPQFMNRIMNGQGPQGPQGEIGPGFNVTGTQNGEYISWDNTNSQWVVEGGDKVKIGKDCGLTNQASKGVSMGYESGKTNQGNSVAIGENAAGTDQGNASISIGRYAGDYQQGDVSIALGMQSGEFQQGSFSIAMGYLAGSSSQGSGAIAIGQYSGYSSQSQNSIVLNATGTTLNGTNSGFYVKPVRSGSATTLQYDTSTGEFVYNTSSLRYKKDLKPVEGYKDILNIEPYCFHYKEEINPQFTGCQVGFIAEHLDQYPSLRELVVYRDFYETKKETDKNGVEIDVNIEGTKETKPESINYDKITCFNLKLIKDLYEENTLLKERLTKIEKQLNIS